MRQLPGVADDAEHIVGREIEDGQPVEDLAAGDAHAVVAFPGHAFGTGVTLVVPDSEAVHEAPAEAGMGFQVAAQLARDR